MVRLTTTTTSLALLVAASISLTTAQVITGDLPNLSTATQTSTSATPSSITEASTTTTDASSTTESSAFVTTGTAVNSGGIFISDLPTIAGAGIPTMVIPYTAAAPFMQQSKLPEGTVFIVVGAVLAFMGACVLFWRGLVAWSINRSVRRSALASIRGNEKAGTPWGSSAAGYNPVRGGGGGKKSKHVHKSSSYTNLNASSLSLDALNPQGKPLKHSDRSETPPAGLFFSPTAQARPASHAGPGPRPLSDMMGNRSSTYLPAGYYASPSSHAAGGAASTTIGGNLAPYARHSAYGNGTSPPASPGMTPTSGPDSRHRVSRDGYGPSSSREGQRAGVGGQRLGAGSRQSHLDADSRPVSRAPSAYLEDLFQEHGQGARERF
jgi:hypothetical protein